MIIEKTYKLFIKDVSYELTEEEVSTLYEACRKALNISLVGPIPTIPPKPFDNPTYPNWPSWPTYPWSGTVNPPNWQQPIVNCNNGTKGINFIESIKDKVDIRHPDDK